MENSENSTNSIFENIGDFIGDIINIGEDLINNHSISFNITSNKVQINVSSSKDENKDGDEYSYFGKCPLNDFTNSKKGNSSKLKVGLSCLSLVLKNKKINNFLKTVGINFISTSSSSCTTYIENLGYCYLKMIERVGGILRKTDYSGECIVYIIFNEKTEKSNEKLEGKSEKEMEEYFKENFNAKYEGEFIFYLPDELDYFDPKELINCNLFDIELNGKLVFNKNMNDSFYHYGNSVVTLFFDGKYLGMNQKSNNVIFINNGEYYKGDMYNYDKTGKGIFISKKGLRIDGNFIDDETIDGLVDIYDKNGELIKKKEFKKAKIKDILKEYEC